MAEDKLSNLSPNIVQSYAFWNNISVKTSGGKSMKKYNKSIKDDLKNTSYHKKQIKELEELIIIQDDDSDTLELNEDENILSMLDDAESEELEEKKAPKQTRNKKNYKEVIKKSNK